MDWLGYLLEANIYLGIFYGCYHFLLKKESWYVVNRWYLVAMSVLSFAIPLVTIRYLQESALVPIAYQRPSSTLSPEVQAGTNPQASAIADTANVGFQLEDIIVLCYQLVVLIFLAKMLFDLYQLILLYRNTKKKEEDGIVFIELPPKKEEVFSFFNWLFIHPNMYANEVIIAHEKNHIRQGHSYDIIFFWIASLFQLV